MKRMVCLALALVLTVLFAPIAWAESTEDYYTEQLEESGAADLPEQLPQQLQPQLFIAGKPQPPQLKRMRIRMMIHQLLLLYIDKYLPNHCFQTIL